MDVWETAKNKVAELERQIEAVGADEEKAQAELKEAMGDVESELEENSRVAMSSPANRRRTNR